MMMLVMFIRAVYLTESFCMSGFTDLCLLTLAHGCVYHSVGVKILQILFLIYMFKIGSGIL